MLAALSNTTPDEAERLLQELSAQTGIKPRHVAELIIEFARTGRLCADLREELEHQLAQRRVPPHDAAEMDADAERHAVIPPRAA